jgi:hypothetical protein
MDSTLHLQRMAFEEAGLGTWKKGVDDVPVTETGEEFAREMEWEDLNVDEALKAKKEKFLSPLEEVEILTGNFSFPRFTEEGEGERVKLTFIIQSIRSSLLKIKSTSCLL